MLVVNRTLTVDQTQAVLVVVLQMVGQVRLAHQDKAMLVEMAQAALMVN